MKPTMFLKALCAVTILLPASDVLAEDYLVSIGGPVAVSGHAPTLHAGDGFLLDAIGARSYSCEGVPSKASSEFQFDTNVVGILASSPDTLAGRATGGMSPLVTGGIGTAGKTRISFITEQADRYRLNVNAAMSGGEPVRVSCIETTLFGGFNTAATNYNFLELRNLSSQTISGFITAYDFNGEPKILKKPFTVLPARRADFDIHSEVGPATYGIIKVTHDGPQHALRGRVSYYQGTPWLFIRRGGVALTPALN